MTTNPHDPNRGPGGSSGGDAALTAMGGSLVGIGTDIAGSTRIPPAFCGVVGLKPTAGRVRYAVVMPSQTPALKQTTTHVLPQQ